MATFLQSVVTPERCFLFELLLWVAFQRLPLRRTNEDGEDVRETSEIGDDCYVAYDTFLYDEECNRAGIPQDPHYRALFDGEPEFSAAHYKNLLNKKNSKHMRALLKADLAEAKKYEADVKAWSGRYKQAVEYPTSEIFVALKGGALKAVGRQIPRKFLAPKSGRDYRDLFYEVELTEIPQSSWTLSGINWKASSAKTRTADYCHIMIDTNEMLAWHPGDRKYRGNVESVGETFILSDDQAKTEIGINQRPRGRPSFPWEKFHLKVAELIKLERLPRKKEAGIELIREWFVSELNLRPSRAAVGEKLKPYYDKLIKPT